MSRPTILLIDDDRDTTGLLLDYLDDFGFDVLAAQGRTSVLALLHREMVDLVVMDLALADADGLALMQEIRRQARVPVLVLSRQVETADRIVALELGADDYMAKPFEQRELLARARAILRRLPQARDRPVEADAVAPGPVLGRWELRRDERRLVSCHGETVLLSASEYRLLNAFLAAPRVVLDRHYLMAHARGRHLQNYERSIDLLVSRLRQKLSDDPLAPSLIRTVRGTGYVFEALSVHPRAGGVH